MKGIEKKVEKQRSERGFGGVIFFQFISLYDTFYRKQSSKVAPMQAISVMQATNCIISYIWETIEQYNSNVLSYLLRYGTPTSQRWHRNVEHTFGKSLD